MQTKHIFFLVLILLSSSAYARDLTTCTASDGTTGYLVENPRVLEENAETVCWSCQQIADYGGVECSRFFNVSIWTGASTVYCDGTYQYTSTPEKDCYIRVPAGYDLDTDYVFDESRYNEAIYECPGNGSYCPGAPDDEHISYTDLMQEYMGSTGAFIQSCPYAPNTYTSNTLKNLVRMTSDTGAAYIYDCYVPAGTYYDSTGTFTITNDNSCYYTDE